MASFTRSDWKELLEVWWQAEYLLPSLESVQYKVRHLTREDRAALLRRVKAICSGKTKPESLGDAAVVKTCDEWKGGPVKVVKTHRGRYVRRRTWGRKRAKSPGQQTSTEKFRVSVENNEEPDDSVMLVVNQPGADKWADKVRYLLGSTLEGGDPGDPDFAYTVVYNYPGLADDLRKELKGTHATADFSQYSPPEPEEEPT